MKALKLSAALLLLGTLTLGLADDVTVDDQIAAIQSATTDEERTELVNEFKTTLSTLSDDERTAAIEQLQSTMQEDGVMLQTQAQTQTRQRSRMNQTEDAQALDSSAMMSQSLDASREAGSGTPPTDMGSMQGGFKGGR